MNKEKWMTIQTVGWPMHAEDEVKAVSRVLTSGRTNYWTGDECRNFEKEFAQFIGTKYAVALMNGTVALEAALCALNIGPNDEVITSCRTFIASASCIVMRGATPVFADVNEDSQVITAETIEPLITKRTKAIIVVHLAGWPADMEAILQLAKKYHLRVIEDCAQAHGAMIHDRYVGSFGDVAAFSFCQDKILTTGGEGGMITTSDDNIWQSIWSLKDHGKNYEKAYRQESTAQFRWLHDSFGTNWRMTEIQAAIGRLQLKKLPGWLALRKRNAEIFNERFKQMNALRITIPDKNLTHAYYKYYVFIKPDQLKSDWNRDRIIQEMNHAKMPCFSGSCSEIYLEQAFKNLNLSLSEPKVVAKKLGETSLMFLIHPTLTEAEVENTANKLLSVMQKACKTE